MTSDQIQQFLLIHDVRRGATEVRGLGTDYQAAIAVYQALEAEHRNDPDFDIVLVGSDSLETVRRTHASYFGEAEAILHERVQRRLAAAHAG